MAITKGFFNTFYPMSSVLAVMEYEQLEKQAGKKAEPTDKQTILNSIFQSKLTEIVNTTAGKKITTITSTSQDAIKQAIRKLSGDIAQGTFIALIIRDENLSETQLRKLLQHYYSDIKLAVSLG